MKKLLGAALVLTMSLTCAGALSACDGCGSDSGDADVAQKAINAVKTMYGDKATETPESYTLIGQTKVDSNNYTVSWSVSSAVNNISDYVSIGEMDETTKLVTVSITKGDEAVEYKLTASVTVGKETKTVDFNRKVPAKPKDTEGTKEDPHSAARVIDIAKTMTPKPKLEESDNPQPVYVKGYIVDCGTDNAANNRVGFVYIVDEYSAEKDKNSADALMILSINYDSEHLTCFNDLKKGNEIMVKGYIMNYLAANSTKAPQPEITYYGSNGVTCEYLQKVEMTDAEKVAAAKEAVDLASKEYTSVDSVTLPTSNNGATLTWTVKTQTDIVTIAEGKLNIVSIPDTETEVTITVTIKSGDVTDTKDIVITVVKGSDAISVADAKAILDTLESNKTYQVDGADKEVYVRGYVTVVGTAGNYGLNNVYIADTAGAAQADSVLIYSINWNDIVVKGSSFTAGDLIIVKGYLKNYNGTKEIAQSGSGSSAIYPVVTSWTKVQLTDAQKVALALEGVDATMNVTKAGETALPVSTVDGVSFAWVVKEGTAATVAEGKLNVAALPDADATVTLTVTASCGEASDTKDVVVTVKKPAQVGASSVFNFAEIEKGSELNATTALELFNSVGGDGNGLTAVTVSKVYQGNSTGGGSYENAGGLIKFGTGSAKGVLTLTFSKNVSKVVINCVGWKDTDKLAVNGSAAQTLVAYSGTASDKEFDLATPSQEVSIETTNRALVFSITVYFAD